MSQLIKAIRECNVSEVEKLLRRKEGDIEQRDKDSNFTPLHLAIECNSPQIVRLLLEAGANPNASLSFNLKYTGGAVSKDNDDYESKFSKAASPLHFAVDRGSKELVRLLAQAKCNVNAQNSYGYTALHLAVDRDLQDEDTIMVATLLDAGADTNIKSKEVRTPTPLLRAIANGQSSVVKCLIKAKADVNARTTNWNGTALMIASAKDNIEIVSSLLNAGADVNAQSNNRCTALIFAVSNNAGEELIKLLLNAGADPNLKSNIGESPLSEARKNRLAKIENILRQAGATT